MPEKDKRAGADTRERIVRALEEIAFSPEGDTKTSERMKAMELLGKLYGLWKDERSEPEGIEGELTKLAELLEQRRVRREGA